MTLPCRLVLYSASCKKGHAGNWPDSRVMPFSDMTSVSCRVLAWLACHADLWHDKEIMLLNGLKSDLCERKFSFYCYVCHLFVGWHFAQNYGPTRWPFERYGTVLPDKRDGKIGNLNFVASERWHFHSISNSNVKNVLLCFCRLLVPWWRTLLFSSSGKPIDQGTKFYFRGSRRSTLSRCCGKLFTANIWAILVFWNLKPDTLTHCHYEIHRCSISCISFVLLTSGPGQRLQALWHFSRPRHAMGSSVPFPAFLVYSRSNGYSLLRV